MLAHRARAQGLRPPIKEKKREPQTEAQRQRAERQALRESPAVQCVRGVTGRYPPAAVWPMLVKRLGAQPDGKRFAQVYQVWCARGNKPTNLDGVCDWYEKGVPEQGPAANGKNGNGHQGANGNGRRTLPDLAEFERESRYEQLREQGVGRDEAKRLAGLV